MAAYSLAVSSEVRLVAAVMVVPPISLGVAVSVSSSKVCSPIRALSSNVDVTAAAGVVRDLSELAIAEFASEPVLATGSTTAESTLLAVSAVASAGEMAAGWAQLTATKLVGLKRMLKEKLAREGL